MGQAKKKRFGKEILLLGGLIGVIAIVTTFGRGEDIEGNTTGCKVNLVNMATVMEMYATDNHGRFPESLSLLQPDYLKAVPICPGGGEYRLEIGPNAAGNVKGYQDYYLFTCSSEQHPMRLAYNAIQGQVEARR